MTGGFKIRYKWVYVIALIAIVSFATMASGCTTTGSTGPSPSAGAAPSAAASQAPPASGSPTKAKVAVSGDTITITGAYKGNNDYESEPFDLKAGSYLLTIESQNSFNDNGFAGRIESIDHPDDLAKLIQSIHGSGSLCLNVDNSNYNHEGPHKLVVQVADKYKVTISKPATADPAPFTLTGKAESSMAKPVYLNAGSVTLDLKADQPAMHVARLCGPDGKQLISINTLMNKQEVSKTVDITTPGVYIVEAKFAKESGGTASVSQ